LVLQLVENIFDIQLTTPKFDESPRIGFQALRALARWLGSRNERMSASACLANAAPEPAAGRPHDAGAAGSAAASGRLSSRGEGR
jgi:hypothetical protein